MKLGLTGTAAAFAMAAVFAAPASAEVLGKEGGFIYVKKERKLPNGPGPEEAGAIAPCPAGSVLTGGGAAVTGKPAGTAISNNGAAAPAQWAVAGWHTGINPKNETVTAYGICTEKTDEVSRVAQSQFVGAAPGGANEDAYCANGHAVGGGVQFNSPVNNWWLNSTGAVDAADSDEAPDDGWVVWVEHVAGPPAEMIVNVICMEGKKPKYRDKAKETNRNKAAVKVFCPKRTSATGGGAFASLSTDAAHVLSSAPIDSKKDPDSVPDDGWKAKFFNDGGTNQTFTASVVCK